MSMDKEQIKKDKMLLQKWLKIPGNTQTLLAAKLGYKSSGTINQWLLRKTGIPSRGREAVLRIIQK